MANGVFSIFSYHDGGQSGSYDTGGVSFDASRQVPTGPENNPINKSVRYLIRALP